MYTHRQGKWGGREGERGEKEGGLRTTRGTTPEAHMCVCMCACIHMHAHVPHMYLHTHEHMHIHTSSVYTNEAWEEAHSIFEISR